MDDGRGLILIFPLIWLIIISDYSGISGSPNSETTSKKEKKKICKKEAKRKKYGYRIRNIRIHGEMHQANSGKQIPRSGNGKPKQKRWDHLCIVTVLRRAVEAGRYLKHPPSSGPDSAIIFLFIRQRRSSLLFFCGCCVRSTVYGVLLCAWLRAWPCEYIKRLADRLARRMLCVVWPLCICISSDGLFCGNLYVSILGDMSWLI